MKKLLLHIIIFTFPVIAAGQQLSYSDSLMLRLNDVEEDTTRVMLMNEIASIWAAKNPALSMEYAQKAFNISDEIDYSFGICKSCMLIADNYHRQNAQSKAYDFYHQALNIAEKENNKTAIAEISNALGVISFEMNNLDKSLNYHYRSVKLYFELNDEAGLAETYTHIGKTYQKQDKFDQALNIFNKALYINRSLKNSQQIAENYGNVGSVMLVKKDRQCETFFRQQIKSAQKYKDTLNLATGNYYLANYYQTFGKPDSAIPFYQNSLTLFTMLNNYEWMSRVYDYLSTTMASKGNFREAYDYLSQHEKYRDSLKTEQMAKLIAQQETKYTFYKQLEDQKLTYNRRSLMLQFIAVFLLILLIFSGLYFYFLQKKIKAFNTEKTKLISTHESTKNELERKKRELTTQSIYQIKKNENLEHLSKRLKREKFSFKKQNQAVIDEIIRDLRNCANDFVWEEFEKRFEEVHTGFYKKLNYRFPNLTTNDKRLCAFLRMNMTTKEIANITKQTPNSIEVGRTRLRKKLNISNKDISISAFLNRI